jgi:hypothetical protein
MQPGIRGELFFADAEALYSYERTYQNTKSVSWQSHNEPFAVNSGYLQ